MAYGSYQQEKSDRYHFVEVSVCHLFDVTFEDDPVAAHVQHDIGGRETHLLGGHSAGFLGGPVRAVPGEDPVRPARDEDSSRISIFLRIISHEICIEIVYTKCYYSIIK